MTAAAMPPSLRLMRRSTGSTPADKAERARGGSDSGGSNSGGSDDRPRNNNNYPNLYTLAFERQGDMLHVIEESRQ